MVYLLKPFEEITRYVCGSKYSTLNLVNLIYGSEDTDTSNDSSLNSDNEWQYAHRSAYYRKGYVNCFGLLEKARADIFLSIDELWNTSNKMGLKASILDPRAIKLLLFATIPEREQTEAQIRAELLLLKTQLDDSN
ncbi:36049_t:CDS:2, partial [Racocetra persica]